MHAGWDIHGNKFYLAKLKKKLSAKVKHGALPTLCFTYKMQYSKTCLKRPLKNRQNKGLKDKCKLNEGRKYYRMLSWSILQYF